MIFSSSPNSHQSAYQTYLEDYETPFCLFGSSGQSLSTIVHEMGHYYAGCFNSISDIPLDLAEVHSQANEWLLLSYLRGALATRNVFKAIELYRAYSGMWTMLYATIVDEYEEAVYNTENLTADALSGIMAQIAAKYDVNWAGLGYTPFQYAQLVTLTSPVYYLSYATSEAAAMSLYLVEADQGYEAAQEVFRKLQEEVDLSKSFSEMVTGVGLLNPFAEETFVKFVEVFG
jgi:oligoendopeptidase F